MKTSRVAHTALRALVKNPMRAGLTMLGIFIGVGAVIVMMSIARGSAMAIQETVARMGADNLMILPGAVSEHGANYGTTSAMTLTAEDAKEILGCPAIRADAPVVRTWGLVVFGHRNWATREVMGTTPSYLDVRNWLPLEAGRAFTDREVRNSEKVCLLGQTIAHELFGDRSPLGQEVRVDNVALRVLGVLSAKGANMLGRDQDDILLAPYTTIKRRISGSTGGTAAATAGSASTTPTVNGIDQPYPRTSLDAYPAKSAAQLQDTPGIVSFSNIDLIIAAARSARDIHPAMAQITALLRRRHRLQPGARDDFRVRDLTEMTNTMTKMSDTMAALLLVVASISLLVGGVGIMNTMLVSVTERTREIGLRMAVGARPKDVLHQFLVEAVVLCVIGGALGIAAGLGGASLIQHTKGWPTQTSSLAILLGLTISAAVGVAFGSYPAWKASQLDPIDALRHE